VSAPHLVEFVAMNGVDGVRWQVFPSGDLGKEKFKRLLTGSLSGSTDFTVPIWPGRSIVRFHSPWANEPQDVPISLPAEGGVATVTVPAPPEAAISSITVRNPHETCAEVVLQAAASDRRSRFVRRDRIEPLGARTWRVLRGQYDLVSAVFPGGSVKSRVVLANEDAEFEVPHSPLGASFEFVLEGREYVILGVTAKVDGGDSMTRWLVAYEEDTPTLFVYGVRLRSSTFRLVVDSPTGLTFRFDAPGLKPLTGLMAGPARRTLVMEPAEQR